MSDIQKRPAAAPPGGAMPKVKDALGYLEKVKNKFANKPHVYNQFLDIMKDFKSQNIDTEGVIVRVKTLFKGNRNLILGFNQFLPPGYKIEMPLEPKPSGGAAQSAAGPAAPPAPHQPPYYPPYEQAPPPQRHQPPHQPPTAPGAGAGGPQPAAAPGGAGQGAGQGQTGAPGQPKTTIEFNHAVQYVAKIKNRFRDQPQIYAEFLDILHDYQARRTIEDVYKRVQDLFLGQQDLLDEFKYFLPDTSNQMGAGPLPKRMGKVVPQKNKPGKGDKPSLDSGRPLKRGRTPKPGEEQAMPGRKLGLGQPSLGGGLSGPAAVAAAKDKAKAAAQRGPPITFPAGSEEEIAVLDKIKGALPKSQFNQVLKLLNLFAQGVLTRQQMVRSIEGILQEKHSDLAERFKNAIEYVEWEENAAMTEAHSSFTAFMTSAALNRCPQPTPSYRTLPDDLPVPGCSGRTTLSEEVLNDRVISLPTGSEEGSSFKSTRKNIYEENLFRCEDERFELDMVIENNASTIKMLEPLAKEIAAMSAEQAKTFRLGKALHILHLRSIQRLYGDQGHEFCELLKRSPATAVPVVLARCKQKDEEWRKLRSEMKTTWRKVTEQNYYRSLDHRSFYFKQEDKRRLMGKNLVSNLREIHNQVFGDSKGKDVYESEAMRHLEQEGPIYTYCLRFKFPEVSLHEDLYGIVMHVAESQCTEQEQRKIKAFFDTFIHPYFNVNLEGRLLSHPAAKPHARLRKRPELDSPSDAEDNESAGEEKKEEAERERERDDFEDEDIDMDSAPLDSYGGHSHSHSHSHSSHSHPKPSASPTPSAPSEPSMAANSAAASAFEHEASSVVPGGGDVKPLLIAMSTWEAEQKVAPVRKHSRPSKLFFANNALYIFFRLHQFLYSRLLKGKQLAFKHKLKSASAANKNKRGKKKKRRPDPTTKEEAHEQFKALLYELIDGDIDSSRYEDELRSLLGASSFVLYTLDKLVFHLIKSLQAIVNNENCMKLLSLFRYEHERWQLMEHTEERSAQHLRMYHNNSSNLIGDDNCVQIEYFEDTYELCFGLADGPSSFESKAANAEESAYVHAYLQPIEDGEQAYRSLIPTHVKPFLKRNVTHSPFTRESAMANVSMVNKLQSMISTRSYKIHYGDDTHDIFVRLVPKKRALLRKALAAKSEEEVEMPPTGRTLRGQALYRQRFLALNPGWDEAHDHDHLELSRTPSPPVKQEKDFGALDAAAAGAVAELARGRPQRSSRRTANAPSSDVEAGDDSSVAGDRDMASSPNEAAAAGAEAISAMAQAAALDAEMDAEAGDGDGLDDDGGADGGDGDGGDAVGDMETDEQMPEGAQ